MASKNSGWGGARDNAGRNSTWKHGGAGTKLVRIPVALERPILEAARRIDNDEIWKASDFVTESSVDALKSEVSHLKQRLEAKEEMVTVLEKRLQILEQDKEQLLRENQQLKSESNSVTKSSLSVEVIRMFQRALTTEAKGGVWNASKGGEAKKLILKALKVIDPNTRFETVTKSKAV